MALYINGNKTGGGGGGNSNMRELTQAEYDALTTEEKNNGTIYYITDGDDNNGGYQLIQPIIYSEEEREVGVWTDGKPLYQKTYELSNPLTVNNSNWTSTGIDKENIDKIIYCIGMTSDGTCWGDLCATVNIDSYIGLLTTRNGDTESVKWFTIQYTKTTDVAGSGKWTPQGTPAVHYSTEEQVVGTWVDGSTIYEKTVIVSNMMIGYDGIIHTSIPHNISNFGYAISLNILCPKIGISAGESLNDIEGLIAEFRVDDTNIYAHTGKDHYGESEDRVWYFIVRYTKTTT